MLSAEWAADPFGVAAREPLAKPEFGNAMERGKIALVTLYDGIAAGEACDALEDAGIDVEVRDLSETAGRGSGWGGQPTALQLIVSERDRDSAVKLLAVHGFHATSFSSVLKDSGAPRSRTATT